MRQNCFLLLITILITSCGNESESSKINQVKSVEIESSTNFEGAEFEEYDYERETYSLGYPSYYAHPELNSVADLEAILKSSDRVMAYNYNKGQENPANMCDDNQYLYNLESAELISNSYNEMELKVDEKGRLIDLLCDSSNYSGSWSGLAGVCYIPHVGFGFFKQNSLLAQASVCFMCTGIRTNPFYKSDGLSGTGLKKFDAFVNKIGLEIVYK